MTLQEEIQAELKRQNKSIVILDDDPTGGQTVHNVPVLTEWTKAAIQREFEHKTPVFFVLTNSRSLIAEEANRLGREIGKNIVAASLAAKREFYIISRGDSTLRGHFPNEIEALTKGLNSPPTPEGETTQSPPSGVGGLLALIPAFFEGNRFTKKDIHYWKNGEDWIPVGETPYAKDATFGYKNSDLKLWIEEKTKGKTKASEVVSFDPNTEGVDVSIKKLKSLRDNTTLIVNALNYDDLEVFALAALRCEKRIIYRTSASFVKSFSGISTKPILTNADLIQSNATKTGGLIVVGSHVPKTTAQLNELLKTDITAIEFNVYQFFMSDARPFVSQLILKIDEILRGGKNVVLYTSRNVVLGKNKEESLQLSTYVSNALLTVVKNLSVRPKFLVAKGGITSSDLATKALGVKRAIVLGQIVASVPVWQLGEETKFPNMPYIIFPGNVGSDEDLKNVYQLLK
jgi:uncharacterized protein YgbK (DUF1537 family)